MSSYVFVNISSGHFKVWGHDLFSSTIDCTGEVITYWGRIGIPMHRLQKNRKDFAHIHNAWDYAKKKVEEKICKGYKAIPNWMYFQMIQSPRGIAALIEKVKHLEDIHETYYRSKREAS